MTHAHAGGCHCGNIRYRYITARSLEKVQARACGCTFCTKIGGRYTSDPNGALNATIENRDLVRHYRFGTKTAEFVGCARCGIVPFVTSEIDGHTYAVVNVNTFDGTGVSQQNVAATNFDGETQSGRLARRKQNWTPRVQVEFAGSG